MTPEGNALLIAGISARDAFVTRSAVPATSGGKLAVAGATLLAPRPLPLPPPNDVGRAASPRARATRAGAGDRSIPRRAPLFRRVTTLFMTLFDTEAWGRATGGVADQALEIQVEVLQRALDHALPSARDGVAPQVADRIGWKTQALCATVRPR